MESFIAELVAAGSDLHATDTYCDLTLILTIIHYVFTRTWDMASSFFWSSEWNEKPFMWKLKPLVNRWLQILWQSGVDLEE